MFGIKQHEYVLKKDRKKYADYVSMPANEQLNVDAKVDNMLMARLMIEGSSEENGISLHLKNQYSEGSKDCYPETLSDAVGMIDNYDGGVATKTRHHNHRSDNNREPEDNIAGAHVSDTPNDDNSYEDDDGDSYAENRSDDDTIDETMDDEQNAVEYPTDAPNNVPSNNGMAAILAAVENDPLPNDPNQYAPLDDDDDDDDDMSFCDESIGEIAGIMVAEVDDESDDDSIPPLMYRDGDDESSDDSSERTNIGQ